LKKELDIYRSFEDLADLDRTVVEKIITESKEQYRRLDKKRIFNIQTLLIQEVNKDLGKLVWDSFLSQYKKIATLNQVLAQNNSPKYAVMVEQKLIESLCAPISDKKPLPNINNLAMKQFIDKFNTEYSNNLNEHQKTLLNKYIMSYHDDGMDLKIYLYEEIDRLKVVLHEYTIGSNPTSQKIAKVAEKIENYHSKRIDTKLISEIIKIQALTSEL